MEKKAIAAVLLLAIAAWAELALAPMLLMHAGHVHLGRGSGPDAGQATVLAHSTHHHAQQAPPAAMPCCPGLQKADTEGVLILAASAPACDDSHSCCFRQGPQSVPATVRDVQRLEREIAPVATAKVSLPTQRESQFGEEISPALRADAEVFGMTLRI